MTKEKHRTVKIVIGTLVGVSCLYLLMKWIGLLLNAAYMPLTINFAKTETLSFLRFTMWASYSLFTVMAVTFVSVVSSYFIKTKHLKITSLIMMSFSAVSAFLLLCIASIYLKVDGESVDWFISIAALQTEFIEIFVILALLSGLAIFHYVITKKRSRTDLLNSCKDIEAAKQDNVIQTDKSSDVSIGYEAEVTTNEE